MNFDPRSKLCNGRLYKAGAVDGGGRPVSVGVGVAGGPTDAATALPTRPRDPLTSKWSHHRRSTELLSVVNLLPSLVASPLRAYQLRSESIESCVSELG